MGKWLSREEKHIHHLPPEYELYEVADGSKYQCDCGDIFVVKGGAWLYEKDLTSARRPLWELEKPESDFNVGIRDWFMGRRGR